MYEEFVWMDGWREGEKARVWKEGMSASNIAFAQDYSLSLSPVEPNQFPAY